MKFAPSPREHLTGQKFYRFQDCSWSEQHVAQESVWYAIRSTPKGYWITDEYAIQEKFVLASGKKRFAYPTRQEAFDSYMKRKEKQVLILSNMLNKANQRLVYNRVNGLPVEAKPLEDQSEDFGF